MKRMSTPELREALLTCLAVPRWVDEVASQSPFESAAALLAAARTAATPLSRSEIDEALSAHPRIGETPRGDSQAARFSRSEQSSADAADSTLAAAIAEGNRAYEERFGRVFLIRAAGRSRTEILAELHRRLALDDAAELKIVGTELRDIALLRLATLAGTVAERLAAERATRAGAPDSPDSEGLVASVVADVVAATAAAGNTTTPAAVSVAATDAPIATPRSRITTHVLDAVSGRPAADVPVELEQRLESGWHVLASAGTDADGRVSALGPADLPAGRYRLTFDTGRYFAGTGQPTLYPEVSVTIDLTDPAAHYHVPLLLSPFAYSTYRGS
ncbi:2-oxo-4-hydroxy-4-carboxy-5-ureidoimidazoline decarboxylase [Cryobacterium breve]|uniref:2-oxo-4-hydroxy-4-carboxy-5-ureidoimidazoline decarboxylase n=1 Tax=Cryobacterium breve TaxID=1259258 RepID=UPI003D7C3545